MKNWRFIFPLLFFLALAGNNAGSQPMARPPQPTPVVKVEPSKIQLRREANKENGNLDEPCVAGTDRRDSDLCAQWKAADAAANSAFWSAVASIVSAFGIVGVAATLYLMLQSNRHAREATKRQLRAYVSFKSGAISDIADGSNAVVHFELVNAGQTPCKILASATGLDFVAMPIAAIPTLNPIERASPSSEGAGGTWTQTIGTKRPLNLMEYEDYRTGRSAFVASCEIHYEDIFGDRHRTLITVYRAEGRGLPANQISVCEIGNDAT